MKKVSKIFSVIFALMLVFAMVIPAFAAETWTGSITIKSADNVSVDGKTFKAYKLLDAVAVDNNNLEAGVLYSIPAELAAFFAEYGANVDEVVEAIEDMNSEQLQAFASAALSAAKTANVTPATATGSGTAAVFSDLAFGYYVIEDAGTATPISALMLRTTSAEVAIKADKPAIEKKIDGENDADGTTTGLVDYNTATVGETVPYVLTSKVPAMEGYTSYTYTVTDTFSVGLTFNNDVVITVGDKTLVKDTDFTVTTDGQKVTINFIDFIKYAKDAVITIKYSATVNEDAIIGVEGNPNTVNLTYSDNPQDANSNATTPDDVVYTYLVDLIINKTNPSGAALAGASFAVENVDGGVIATGTSDADGKVVFTWTDGVGLKDGETYKIVETDAPAGYNKADDITFKVTCQDPATDTDCIWSSDNALVTFEKTDGTEDDYFVTTIVNSTGGLLPETGGIGTTIFYIIGALLVVGAIVLLITKKRMSAEV